MGKGRLEAFTDGVVAIIITIMVLEMKVPRGADFAALSESVPVFSAYVLSFVNVGIFWNNHHHMMHATGHIDGRVLWANLFLLFWLSLIPFVIRWIDEAGLVALPVAAYGVVLAMAAVGYGLLKRAIMARDGPDSPLAAAIGSDLKGKCLAIWGLAFKPRTDDIREAPALCLIDAMLEDGVRLRVHDPEALAGVRALYGDRLIYCDRPYGALEEADGLAIVTEWQEFHRPDFALMRRLLRSPVIFDGRNIFEPKTVRALGFTYYGIGR